MGVCKAALDAAVKYLAFDLGRGRSGSMPSRPGPVKTLAASAVGDFDKLAELYEMSSPMDRNITREEVGSAGMFLLSDHASGITGEVLHVDCGYNVMGSPGRAIEKVKALILAKVQAASPSWQRAAKRRRAQAIMSESSVAPIAVGLGWSGGATGSWSATPGGHRLRPVLGISRRQVRAGRDAAQARSGSVSRRSG